MFTFTVKTAEGIGSRDIEATDIQDCFNKLGWVNPKIEFQPYSQRIKFKDMEWQVNVPSLLSGHSSRYSITVKK